MIINGYDTALRVGMSITKIKQISLRQILDLLLLMVTILVPPHIGMSNYQN
jgi:hypothetical protein